MSPPRFTTGWVHNLVTPPPSTEAGRVIALGISFSTIAIACIVIRFSIRWRLTKSFHLDDYAAAWSTALGIGYSAVAIYQTRWGLGLDAQYFPLVNAIKFSKIQYIGGPIYCLAVLGFKMSLLASYFQVAGFNRSYRRFLIAAMVIVTANQLLYTFLLSFACRPIHKQWDPEVPGQCIDQLATYFGLGGSSLGCDLIIIVLPFPILKRLQLGAKNKLAVGAMYGLGFFISIIQIVRMFTIARLKTYTDSLPIIEWSMVEINLGVLIACMPTFLPLFRHVGRRVTQVCRAKSSNTSRNASSGAGSDAVAVAPDAADEIALVGQGTRGDDMSFVMESLVPEDWPNRLSDDTAAGTGEGARSETEHRDERKTAVVLASSSCGDQIEDGEEDSHRFS